MFSSNYMFEVNIKHMDYMHMYMYKRYNKLKEDTCISSTIILTDTKSIGYYHKLTSYYLVQPLLVLPFETNVRDPSDSVLSV